MFVNAKKAAAVLCPESAVRSRVSVFQAHAVEGGELAASDWRQEEIDDEEERVHVLRLCGRHGNGQRK